MSSLHTGQLKYQVQEAKALLPGEKAAGRRLAYQCTHPRAPASRQPFRQQTTGSGDLFPWILARKGVMGTAQSPPFYRLLAETKEVVTAARRPNSLVWVKLQHLSDLRCASQICRAGFSRAGGTRPHLRHRYSWEFRESSKLEECTLWGGRIICLWPEIGDPNPNHFVGF